jgi:ribonuclease HII
MSLTSFDPNKLVAGLDEAGRGSLAGPVVAAAVVFPKKYSNPELADSKKLSRKKRLELSHIIKRDALSWATAVVDNKTIDEINILNASFEAMHDAVKQLTTKPEILLVDGNRFNPYEGIEHRCMVKGDNLYYSIAAASILAKTTRDSLMAELHERYPVYHWHKNVGYPTILHREAIKMKGISPYHRKTFQLLPRQLEMFR